MIKIRLITFQEGEYPAIEIDDTYPKCSNDVIDELESLKLKGGRMILIEFLAPTKPSIAGITIGFLERKYEVIAVTERDWDNYIVVISKETDLFNVGQILD